jgi:type IV fimbrial biogenesis protein FimT
MKREHGFTLLEIIVTLAIIAVVMAVAIPGMGTFIKNERLTTQINSLVGHLAYARSEAVLRTQQVAVCVSDDTTSCSGGTTWGDGWIVYVDADGNSNLNGGELILRVQQTLEGDNTLTPTTIGTQVIYDFRGFLSTPVGSLLLCDDRSGPYGKTLSISTTGRVRASRGATC